MLAADLAARLRSRSAAVRLSAVEELSRAPGRDTLPLLLKALDDRSNLVVAAAARGLERLGAEQAVQPMISRYEWLSAEGQRRDPGCVARMALISALTACQADAAAPVFCTAIRTYQPERTGLGMDDTAIPLRALAAGGLARLQPPGALLALSLLLFDIEPRVPVAPTERLYATMPARIAAARALACLGEAGAVAVLGVRLSLEGDEVPEVLVECMDALAALDEEAAIQLVAPFLRHKQPYLVAGAATALARLSQPARILPLLQAACEQAGPEAREAVALAIAAVRADAAGACLAALAEHHDPSVRLAAVHALGERGDVAVLSALAERQSDRRVAAAAKEALTRLKGG